MSFSNYLENKVLDHIAGKATFAAVIAYVALSTADPTEDGSAIAEPSGNGYARKATAATDWNSATNGGITNATTLTFPQASGSWGLITHSALFDAPTGGNFLASGSLDVNKTIALNDTASFVPGQLQITLD